MSLKVNIIMLLACVVTACNGQHQSNQKTIGTPRSIAKKIVNMEKFDVKKYEERKIKDPFYDGYQKDENLYVQQFHQIKEGYGEEHYTKALVTGFTETLEYKNGYKTVKEYDQEGNIKHLKQYFANKLEIGKWQDFDASGVLIKEEDKDLNYKTPLSKILDFGKKNEVDFGETGAIERYLAPDTNKYTWKLVWNTDKPVKEEGQAVFRTVVIDDATGKIISDQEHTAPLFSRKKHAF